MSFLMWSVMLKMPKSWWHLTWSGEEAWVLMPGLLEPFYSSKLYSLAPLPPLPYFLLLDIVRAIYCQVTCWILESERVWRYFPSFGLFWQIRKWDFKILAPFGIQDWGIPSASFDFCAVSSASQSSALPLYWRSLMHIPTPGISSESVARSQRHTTEKGLGRVHRHRYDTDIGICYLNHVENTETAAWVSK